MYIIIFAILMLLGGLEKVMKAKRQQNLPPPPPNPYDDFEDVEEQPSQEQSPPQSIEEMMRRMMQTIETPKQEEVVAHQKQHTMENIPEKYKYKPVQSALFQAIEHSKNELHSTSPTGEEKETSGNNNYVFDIRQAVIASEILNRKY